MNQHLDRESLDTAIRDRQHALDLEWNGLGAGEMMELAGDDDGDHGDGGGGSDRDSDGGGGSDRDSDGGGGGDGDSDGGGGGGGGHDGTNTDTTSQVRTSKRSRPEVDYAAFDRQSRLGDFDLHGSKKGLAATTAKTRGRPPRAAGAAAAPAGDKKRGRPPRAAGAGAGAAAAASSSSSSSSAGAGAGAGAAGAPATGPGHGLFGSPLPADRRRE